VGKFFSVKAILGQLPYLVDLGDGDGKVKVQTDERLNVGVDGFRFREGARKLGPADRPYPW
jgi:hypothetical protein